MNGDITQSVTDIARTAVHEWLQENDPGAFAPHFRHPSSLETSEEGAPLASTRAARSLTLALQRLLVRYVLRARGAGETWEDVALALALERDGVPDGAAAYLTALGVRADDPWWSPARGVLWTCTTCEQAVRDYGPDLGGPDDREDGHARTCSRHVADVVAWEALWA